MPGDCLFMFIQDVFSTSSAQKHRVSANANTLCSYEVNMRCQLHASVNAAFCTHRPPLSTHFGPICCISCNGLVMKGHIITLLAPMLVLLSCPESFPPLLLNKGARATPVVPYTGCAASKVTIKHDCVHTYHSTQLMQQQSLGYPPTSTSSKAPTVSTSWKRNGPCCMQTPSTITKRTLAVMLNIKRTSRDG
jgi:hypothetical protein